MTKVNIPELLRENRPLGELYIQFITRAGGADQNGMDLVYPNHENYQDTEVEFRLNGVEIPQKMFEEIFFQYAEWYAERIILEELDNLLEEPRRRLEKASEIFDEVSSKIIKDFGLNDTDY